MKNYTKLTSKKLIEDFLRNACKDRNGDIEGLLKFMDDSGFYTSPCSGSHHLCHNGGLAEHSLNVVNIAINTAGNLAIKKEMSADEVKNFTNSIIVCALLHDLGKVGDFGQSNYVVNMIKDCRPTKAEPEQKYKQSESNPYKTNPNIPYVDHEIRSVEYIRKYIELTPDEYQAILWHNGLYGTFKYQIQNKETPLYLILHFADMWASRVVEVESKEV